MSDRNSGGHPKTLLSILHQRDGQPRGGGDQRKILLSTVAMLGVGAHPPVPPVQLQSHLGPREKKASLSGTAKIMFPALANNSYP